jgi:hypothetical protein
MTTTGTVIVTIACIVGYGTLFGPPIVVLLNKLSERRKRGT